MNFGTQTAEGSSYLRCCRAKLTFPESVAVLPDFFHAPLSPLSRSSPAARCTRGRSSRALGIAATLVAASTTAVASNFSWFSSQSAFNAKLEANYAGGLDGLAANPLPPTLFFSGLTAGTGTFSFESTSSAGLYSVFDAPRALTPDALEIPLVFDGFSPGVRAFGGLFSLTDENEARQSGSFTLSIFTGSGTAQTLLTTATASVTSLGPSFLGIIDFDPAISFSRVEFATPSTTLYPTAEQVTVGVPEPSALAGLTTGLLLVAIGYRIRSRLAKAACMLVAVAAFAVPAHAAFAGMNVIQQRPPPASDQAFATTLPRSGSP